MIRISGSIVPSENIISVYPPNSIERKIIQIMSTSSGTYNFNSLDELRFELNLRKNIIIASRELLRSRMSFKVFRKAYCNPAYWQLTNEGGFLLKNRVKPSEAIADIFRNGHRYGTECATAIVIVFYKAVLNVFPEELFNMLFDKIQLMDWQYIDSDLDIGYYVNETDYLPGDCRYFKNPDVNPETPEFQGENAIDLGDGTYYGHGIGIETGDGIIKALNRFRKPGATRSAHLLDSATRPNFKHLSDKYYKFTQSN